MDYDILIVGGGMVGATLACALGDTPLRIAVVEAHEAPSEWPEEGFDLRVSAITRATQCVFEAIGVWPGMVRRRVSPYQRMHVWDATGSGVIDFDAADIGEPDLGLIVENRVILAALLERMAVFDNIELISPVRVSELERHDDGVTLTLEGGRRVGGRVIVGADGANSWVRRQAGIDTTGWAYDQSAVVATVKTSRHHRETCWQCFMPTGPLAFLPLPGGYSSIVWSTTPEHAAELVKMEEGAFLDALQLAFGDRLGRMESTGPRGAFPLLLRHANRYCDERLVLVGNAAHAIHPLAGQGLNLGITDAATLAEVLLQARERKQDIGDLAVLRRYERWRKADNLAVMAAMDSFKRLFSNNNGILKLLRNVG
ncbi:MAG: UbiH/UbiF/VisC/COQ6 family ubiquinone biosynthesis hydroxylase, partial [Gammaproteobacteria bacterium]|nr:UbiH/UbiF/VisC/COQ6 family ubiquinone biosynthesis hydroxylase [Gammaproteobacteria bacterium]